MKINEKPIGKAKVGDRMYNLTHVTMLADDDTLIADLGNVDLEHWNVAPHERNRIINEFDDEKRKAFLEEIKNES